mgnify:CR=1 FL=1
MLRICFVAHLRNDVPRRQRGFPHEGACSRLRVRTTGADGENAIIGLDERAAGPLENATHVLAYNGEIYNFAALRKELDGRGHRFRGHSDTEVMLAAFEAWGIAESLARFNGMFAFGVWDAEARGSFTGLTSATGAPELAQAVLEGAVLVTDDEGLRAVQGLDARAWQDVEPVRAIGIVPGGASVPESS